MCDNKTCENCEDECTHEHFYCFNCKKEFSESHRTDPFQQEEKLSESHQHCFLHNGQQLPCARCTRLINIINQPTPPKESDKVKLLEDYSDSISIMSAEKMLNDHARELNAQRKTIDHWTLFIQNELSTLKQQLNEKGK